MASPEERIAKFKRHTEALNKQFLGWVTSQVGAKPNKLLANGVTDYLRHAAKLRLEFADVIGQGKKSIRAVNHYIILGVVFLKLADFRNDFIGDANLILLIPSPLSLHWCLQTTRRLINPPMADPTLHCCL